MISEKTRKILSDKATRRWQTPGYRSRLSKIHKERWRDPVIRELYRASHVGKIASRESRKRLSDTWARKGHPRGNLGKKASGKTIQNMRFSRMKWLESHEISEETRRKHSVAAALQNTQKSIPNKAETALGELLNAKFPKQFKMNVKDGLVIGGKVPDFVNVNGKKVLVELFGNYWHGEKVQGRTKKQEEDKRKRCFRKFGFKTVIVWESELKNPLGIVAKVSRSLQ